MTREHIIVLRVLDDDGSREWWEALGLPDPARWGLADTFDGGKCFPQIVIEEEVKR